MVRGEIQLIADTLLIQKVVTIDYGIQKVAGYADDLKGMLGQGLSIISENVKGIIDTSSLTSTLEGVGNMLATGGLFKLWWPLGIINAVASSVFGINAVTIAESIWNALKGKFETGEPVTPSEVTEVTKSVTSDLTSVASEDLFHSLRIADQQGKLFQLIKSGSSRGGLFNWMSGLNRRVGRSLIGGFIGWAVKAVLIGAGLLTVSNMAANALGLKQNTNPPKEDIEPKSEEIKPENIPIKYTSSVPTDNLTPTGNGQTKHNQSGSKWIVPLVGGSVENTLLNWAAYVYKEFQDKSKWGQISSTNSFNKMVNQLKQVEESGSNQLTMPKGFESIKQVVDTFSREYDEKR